MRYGQSHSKTKEALRPNKAASLEAMKEYIAGKNSSQETRDYLHADCGQCLDIHEESIGEKNDNPTGKD